MDIVLEVRCRSVWRRLIKSKKFMRRPNLQWIQSYQAFEEDVGLPPHKSAKLVQNVLCLTWTKDTCTWI